MIAIVYNFLVTVPEARSSFTWIGGGLKPSRRKGYVWLTKPGGEPVLEVPRAYVQPISQEQMVKLLVQATQLCAASLN